jgi:hypothetical protein
MRPNALHYVVTMEDALLYGRHFLPTSTVQSTTCGIVHCFIMGLAITNDMRDTLGTMLRRMMAMWHVYYYDQLWKFSPPQDPHIPNLATVDGLMDCIAVGNVLELAQVLDRRAYLKAGIHGLEQQEMAMARWRYRLIQKNFAKFFVTVVGGQRIHPMSIFRRSLMEFAVALYQYKQQTANTAPRVPGCTPASLEGKLTSYFQSNYPELAPAFRKLLDKGVASFTWAGPPIEIRIRTKANQLAVDQPAPAFNFADLVLYETADVQSNAPGQSPGEEQDIVIVGMNEAATQAHRQRPPSVIEVPSVGERDVVETSESIQWSPSAPPSMAGDNIASVLLDVPITAPAGHPSEDLGQGGEADEVRDAAGVHWEETNGSATPVISDVPVAHNAASLFPQDTRSQANASNDVTDVGTPEATEDDEAEPDNVPPSGKIGIMLDTIGLMKFTFRFDRSAGGYAN